MNLCLNKYHTKMPFGLGKVFKRYRIAYYRKKLLSKPSYFIDQFNEREVKQCVSSDLKEVYFYPTILDPASDIKQNKLILILSAENFFLCNGETSTDNKKVIEYQIKLKNISDHFYRECYSGNEENELIANPVYANISSILSSAKSTINKHFKVSPFFNFWHSSLINDNWQYDISKLDTDDYIFVRYKLLKKKHKNFCFNPCLLFGASKENIQIGIDTDDNFHYVWLKIALMLNEIKADNFILNSGLRETL